MPIPMKKDKSENKDMSENDYTVYMSAPNPFHYQK